MKLILKSAVDYYYTKNCKPRFLRYTQHKQDAIILTEKFPNFMFVWIISVSIIIQWADEINVKVNRDVLQNRRAIQLILFFDSKLWIPERSIISFRNVRNIVNATSVLVSLVISDWNKGFIVANGRVQYLYINSFWTLTCSGFISFISLTAERKVVFFFIESAIRIVYIL